MRRIQIAGGALAAILALAGCSTTPEEHPERLRKAAGVTAFRIQCTKDLWNRTGGLNSDYPDYPEPVKAQVTDRGNGTVTVQLSGPQLVDLLKKLDEMAHPFEGGPAPDPLAVRMYDAIAPKVDAIKATPAAGASIPQVTIDDSVGTPSTSTAASASPSPSSPSLNQDE